MLGDPELDATLPLAGLGPLLGRPSDERRRRMLLLQVLEDRDRLPAPAVFVDRKRRLWLLGLVVPLLPLIAAGLVWSTGRGGFWWFGPVFVYGVIPFCELILGTDRDNPPESAVPALEEERYYRRCVYAFV